MTCKTRRSGPKWLYISDLNLSRQSVGNRADIVCIYFGYPFNRDGGQGYSHVLSVSSSPVM